MLVGIICILVGSFGFYSLRKLNDILTGILVFTGSLILVTLGIILTVLSVV